MYILLIIWFIFVGAYVIFNIYGISRVLAMRIKGDATPKAVLFYLITIFIVIAISLFMISQINWGTSLKLF